jgi:hypothetical protein
MVLNRQKRAPWSQARARRPSEWGVHCFFRCALPTCSHRNVRIAFAGFALGASHTLAAAPQSFNVAYNLSRKVISAGSPQPTPHAKIRVKMNFTAEARLRRSKSCYLNHYPKHLSQTAKKDTIKSNDPSRWHGLAFQPTNGDHGPYQRLTDGQLTLVLVAPCSPACMLLKANRKGGP